MDDRETHPTGTAARIAELESANGVHILRALSKQEMVEVEKMAADGKFQEAAQKFGGQVTYHQDQCDLPPMDDAELALHLRGGLVPMSVAYRASSRIEQLVATVEQLEAALTRANAAAAAAYEVAAKIVCERHRIHMTAKGRNPDDYVSDWSLTAAAIRALATPDQTAALDKLIAEAVGPYVEALDAVLAWHDKDKHAAGKMTFERSSVFAKARAASKKVGV